MTLNLAPNTAPLWPARWWGLACLLGVVVWQCYLFLPALLPGYLLAGDDHIHVATANELRRVLLGEQRVLGWNTLFGSGAPMFLLRPPGMYVATVAAHLLLGLKIEAALKLLVLVGLAFYPISMFAGCRLLQLDFFASLCAAVLSPLAISLWGHTIDAYHYLGLHKQLLAILFFPLTVGTLWQLLRYGRCGPAFALLFPAVFLTHPYIAYCLALLIPAMLLACVCGSERWDWLSALSRSVFWAFVALLICGWWLIPFFSSPEIQQAAPYLSARKYFDVTVATVSETLLQLGLGSILDTSAWIGPFGAHEWGWLDNARTLRAPIVTVCALVGLATAVVKIGRVPQSAFIVFACCSAFAVFCGPDDFPLLDAIPFAAKFQNVHSIFLFEWTCFLAGGLGCRNILAYCGHIPRAGARRTATVAAVVCLVFGWCSAAYERTGTAKTRVGVRSTDTHNGDLAPSAYLLPSWLHFRRVAQMINDAGTPGAVTALPVSDGDSIFYNLLPLMVDRSVYLTGFEENGGVYRLLTDHFRSKLLRNDTLQRLFNIRFVVNSTALAKQAEPWPPSLAPLYADEYWELLKVRGEFAFIEPLPVGSPLVGFFGSEEEWEALMYRWLDVFARDHTVPFWIVDLSYTTAEGATALRPLLRGLLLGKAAAAPHEFSALPAARARDFSSAPAASLRALFPAPWPSPAMALEADAARITSLRSGRGRDAVTYSVPGGTVPIITKRAFYRAWRAESDGVSIPTYRLSPGLTMTLAHEGTHTLVWTYDGPNRGRLAACSLWLGVLLLAATCIIPSRIINGAPFMRRFADLCSRCVVSSRRTITRLVPPLLLLAFGAMLFFKVYAEAFRRVPVTIYPTRGQLVKKVEGRHIDVYWNPLVGIPREQQKYTVEVADDPAFVRVVARAQSSSGYVRIAGDFSPLRAYFYRVRFEPGAQSFPWSSAVRFSIAEDEE